MTYIVHYAVALVIFGVVDLVWLNWVARGFYHAEIGHLLAPKINLYAATAFYIIYIAGLMFFVIQPNMAAGGWYGALVMGTLFGFVAYATYDLSNLATLRGWSWKLSLLDIAWGAALTGLTAANAIIVSQYVLRRI